MKLSRTLTHFSASPTAGLSWWGPSISELHFLCILKKLVVLSLRTALSNWWQLCVHMHICWCYISYPITTFYCVPKSHYQFYCVHNNVLQHVYGFDAITFYCTLSEMLRIKTTNQYDFTMIITSWQNKNDRRMHLIAEKEAGWLMFL